MPSGGWIYRPEVGSSQLPVAVMERAAEAPNVEIDKEERNDDEE